MKYVNKFSQYILFSAQDPDFQIYFILSFYICRMFLYILFYTLKSKSILFLIVKCSQTLETFLLQIQCEKKQPLQILEMIKNSNYIDITQLPSGAQKFPFYLHFLWLHYADINVKVYSDLNFANSGTPNIFER